MQYMSLPSSLSANISDVKFTSINIAYATVSYDWKLISQIEVCVLIKVIQYWT